MNNEECIFDGMSFYQSNGVLQRGLLQNYGFATDPLVGSIPPSRLAPCHLPLHKGGFWPGACSDVVLSGEILPISSLKSDNRNTAVPRPPCVKGAVTVGDWGIVSGGELGNLRILQQALSARYGVPAEAQRKRVRWGEEVRRRERDLPRLSGARREIHSPHRRD